MSTRGHLAVGVLATACLVGCGADLGGGLGVEARSGHAVGFGRAAASTRLGTPLNNKGLLVGASIESRTESKLGVRYDAGLMVGWGSGPEPIGGTLGIETYLEAGTPIRGGFFINGDWLLGGTVALPLPLENPRQLSDLNSSTWFASKRLEFVPMARFRLHFDEPQGETVGTKVDLQVGAVFRLRVLSDLL